MFEGYTLGDQRKFEEARGWKGTFRALTYCTAEAVLTRKSDRDGDWLDWEILVAERATGAPDCIGRTQGKWGAYVYPTDPTTRHAVRRGLREIFGWDVPPENFRLAGLVGPWLHKATAGLKGGRLVVSVLEDQAEETPFQATLFSADVTGFDIGGAGSYSRTTAGARWITLFDLITEQGTSFDFMYWTMVALAIQRERNLVSQYLLTEYFGPGIHRFL